MIEENAITDMANGGVYLQGTFDYPSFTTIQNNEIKDNQGPGIKMSQYAKSTINYNNLYNNSGKDVYNDTNASVYSEIDAKYNYWGETTTASMDAGGNPKNLDAIYDSHDDSSKGFVNYGQWLAAEYTSTSTE